MRRFAMRKPSAAMVVSVLALIVALGGTSLAATAVFSPKEKKQIKKIARSQANSQITKRAGGLSVKSALSAGSATTAGTANSAKAADSAKTADTAKTAESAKSASTADVAEVGAPRAYAEIEGDGTVDPGSPSKGIVDADVSRPEPGVYCFELSFTPVTAAANGNPDTGPVLDDAILNFRLDDADFEFCPASAEAEVGYIDASEAALQSDDFNIQFDG